MAQFRTLKGFGFIDVAAILVVIGLVGGGVVFGQHELNEARLSKTMNEIQKYIFEFHRYIQLYGELPGDDPKAADRFGYVANGNGDGMISGTAFRAGEGSEALLTWEHLGAAFLSNKDMPDNHLPHNPYGGVYGFQTGAFVGDGAFTATTVLCLSNLPSAAAEELDARLDDGISTSGTLRASAVSIAGPVSNIYKQGETYVVCIRL